MVVVNLDPANVYIPYKCDINICDLVTLDDIQEELGLGPNGSLVYAMEFLLTNVKWLRDQLAALDPMTYVVFDFPGQVEVSQYYTQTQKNTRAHESTQTDRQTDRHRQDTTRSIPDNIHSSY